MDFSKLGVRLLVKDFAASYDFYTKVMGLTPIWGDRNGPYTSFAAPGAAEPTFALFQAENMALYEGYTVPESQPADKIQLVIPSADVDVDADYERLKGMGGSFLGAPQTIEEWGMRCVVLRDTEGNLIELNNSGSA